MCGGGGGPGLNPAAYLTCFTFLMAFVFVYPIYLYKGFIPYIK